MNYIQRVENWGDTHHAKWLDIVRVGLGIFLCYKAISFLMNISVLIGFMNISHMGGSQFSLVLIGQFIVIVHLMGGFLIMIGLHTRLASLVQIPILIAAIVLLSVSSRGELPLPELATSIIVLLLLICFLVFGNGPWSFSELAPEERH